MSKNMQKSSTHKLILSLTATILAAGGAQAYELSVSTNLPPVDFHGFLSQGFLDSSKYNYLGDTTRGSFNYTEAGINASFNPFPRTRITAQGFLFSVGDVGKYQPFLDYASIEYTFNDWFGLRAGRIRKSAGLYNSIQDVDLARTSVLLPQAVYDARFRDLNATLDGGEAFGTIPLNKAGSLAYEAYSGTFSIGTDSGVADILNNSLAPAKVNSFDQALVAGSQLWWNAPLDGLRIGVSYEFLFDLDYDFNETVPFVGTVPFRSTSTIPLQQYSVEYLSKNWTFQAEYYNVRVNGTTTSAFGQQHSFTSEDAWYGGASYRFNKWLEVGAYYSEYYVAGAALPAASQSAQRDAALSFRFDPTSWWVFKVEGHCIHGTALLDDNASNPVADQNSKPWYMLAVKTTFSF
jgi:hypothetical protein